MAADDESAREDEAPEDDGAPAEDEAPQEDEGEGDDAQQDEGEDDAQQDEDEGEDDDAQQDEGEDDGPDQSAGKGRQNISGTTAPSIGPHTTIEHEDSKERLARHEQSDVDAMGLHKRREVVGGSYGASFAKQATLYGGVLAVVAALVVGFIILTGQLDKSPANFADEAPWSDTNAESVPVEPLE